MLNGHSIRKVETHWSISYHMKPKYWSDWANNKEHVIGSGKSWMILLFISSELGVFKVRKSLDSSEVNF